VDPARGTNKKPAPDLHPERALVELVVFYARFSVTQAVNVSCTTLHP
jgi:hypothetical protein